MITTIIIFVLIGILFVGLVGQERSARQRFEYVTAARADIQAILDKFNELDDRLDDRLREITTKQDNMYRWLNEVSNHVNYPDEEDDE